MWATVFKVKSTVDWPIALVPVVRQYTMVGGHVRGTCSPHGNQEAKREEGSGSQYPRGGHTPSCLTSSH
jgi:hypothetical protein